MGIKEALNNAVKYSGASELLLQIKCHGKKLVVAVQDNGKGFDLETVRPGGTGLSNIVQRMKEQGGNCVITSQPGKGCRIEFTLTLKSARRRPLYSLLKPERAPAQTGQDKPANEASQDNAFV
jgi:nitrate/nitrite-specific signal transduction histidine kinase